MLVFRFMGADDIGKIIKTEQLELPSKKLQINVLSWQSADLLKPE